MEAGGQACHHRYGMLGSLGDIRSPMRPEGTGPWVPTGQWSGLGPGEGGTRMERG